MKWETLGFKKPQEKFLVRLDSLCKLCEEITGRVRNYKITAEHETKRQEVIELLEDARKGLQEHKAQLERNTGTLTKEEKREQEEFIKDAQAYLNKLDRKALLLPGKIIR